MHAARGFTAHTSLTRRWRINGYGFTFGRTGTILNTFAIFVSHSSMVEAQNNWAETGVVPNSLCIRAIRESFLIPFLFTTLYSLRRRGAYQVS